MEVQRKMERWIRVYRKAKMVRNVLRVNWKVKLEEKKVFR